MNVLRRLVGRTARPVLCAWASTITVPAVAAVSASLSWSPSADPNIAGYNIYYGGASHQYTNSVSVGLVTNILIAGLTENKTYYFAAKAVANSGAESDFSNEAAYSGVTATPNGPLHLKTLPKNLTGDPLTFSLGADAPAGAIINATNGVISWTPGAAYASTTNYLTVTVTDTANPALSTTETLVVFISDFLTLQLPSTAVSAGQTGSLPIVATASSTVTNLSLTLDWPDAVLTNPTLTVTAPVVAGTLQDIGGQLVIQLQTAANQPLSGTNVVAQINFQTAASPCSTIYTLPVSNASGTTADGTTYANVTSQPGEVVVVGATPLLRPQTDPTLGRSLTLYANPGTYQLQYTTSLIQPIDWQLLTTYSPTNVAENLPLDSANPAVYYRLQQM